MEMIERAARAISGQDEAGWRDLPENDRERLYGGGKWHDAGRTRQDYRDEARAAIEAMREPTEAMCMAALEVERTPNSDSLAGDPARWKRPTWQAMIDAALSTPPEPVGREK